MKKDNETKMKEILSELEDELDEDVKKEETVEEEVVEEETTEEEVVEEETTEEEVVEEETTEDEVVEEETTVEEEVEDETTEDEVVEEETTEEEVVEEETTEEEVEEETTEEEEIEDKKENIESPIKKIGDYLIEKIKKYKYLFILDFVVFLLLFFLIPTVILEVQPFIWMALFLVFTILPTVAFYLRKLFKKYQIMMGVPFFYLLILCILDSCTIKDLYGITAHGELDKAPAWIDALLVTFIIVFFQYIGLTVINLVRRPRKRARK